ncbi:FtsX-like permease family protein [Actinomadura oligospora]|uniref:FtsX-like permease family protein n=1 Tax=Actinomadura oligospora TaxID=111804 RepID=UPI0004B0427A|nr:FtsX-like permease family protein [Actinomadura oligospora]
MLKVAVATLRHRLTGFVGAFVALALGTAMIGMMALTLAATAGTPHPGPQRFKDAPVVVAPPGFEGNPMKAPAVLPPDVVAQVSAVGHATADRGFPVRPTVGPSSDVIGHPWSSAAFARYRLTAGRAPAASDEVVIGGGSATLVGRGIPVATRDGVRRYQVVGVTGALWFENAVFFSDMEAARLSPGVNALVTDQDPARLSKLVGDRAAVLAGRDRIRIDPDDTGGSAELSNARGMAGSTTGLAVCVAVFVVIATFAFATEQRRRELALLRLVGAAPRQVRRMVLGEALLVGVAAATTGCALAPLGTVPLRSWMLDHGVAPPWFTIPFDVVPLLIAFVLGVAAALTGAAATLPRVSLIRPVEVLRESAVERRAMTPIRLLLGTAMLAGAVVAGIQIARTTPYLAATVRKYEAVPVLYVGAVALLSPLLLRPVTRLLLAPLRGSTKAGPLLVRENILTSRRRTAAIVTPIVLAVGLVGTLLTMQKSGDAATLVRQRQEVRASAVVMPGSGMEIDARTLARLSAVPGIRVTPVSTMNVRIGTVQGEQIDSLTTNAVPPRALNDTVRPPVRAGSLASLPENFLVIDEHAAESDDLAPGDHVIALLPSGRRVPTVIAAVVARGPHGDDTYISSSLTGTTTATQVYLDGPLDTTALHRALAGTGAHLMTFDAYLAAERSHASRQTNNAAVVILGIALTYSLIAIANTLVMAMSARRREFALLGLTGTTRAQIIRITAAESAIAVVVGTLLAAVATTLAALTQHASLTKLAPTAPTVIPWPQIAATTALCTLIALATATTTTWQSTRPTLNKHP